MLCSYLFQVLMILCRCDDKQQQRPGFMGITGYLKTYSVGSFIECLHIAHQPVMGNVPFTYLMTNNRGGCWYLITIRNAFRQIVTEVSLCVSFSKKANKDQKQFNMFYTQRHLVNDGCS